MTAVLAFDALSGAAGAAAGGKGASLARLYQAGLPVPDGFVVLPDGFAGEELLPAAWALVQAQLARLRVAAPETAFAVRSSAQSEDSAQASFAGEFETVLNARTDDEVLAAIGVVYRSRLSERVQTYSSARGMSTAHEIAVVVQRLAPAESAGVLFTADPVTGRRDRAVVNAAWGLGEAVVQGFVTPDTVTVDKTTGRVLARETADKRVMTVLVQGGTAERPVPESRRRAPALTDGEAAELVRLGMRVEASFGVPVDVEWTLAGGEFALVQARPITALPACPPEVGTTEPPPPTRWQFKGIAMRNNIVELMAEPLTPLFDTLGRAAINASLGRLLTQFFGRPGVMPDELIVSVNHYAYFNGSMRLGQALRLIFDAAGIAKRMFTGAVERWTEAGRPRYVAVVAEREAERWRDLPAADLLGRAREVSEASIDAYGALVGGVIPAAWISEALFTFVYNLLIRRRDDPPAQACLLGFDSAPIQAEKALYDLAEWARTRAGLAAYLRGTPAARLAAGLEEEQPPAGVPSGDWSEWRQRFRAHLQRFGHAIYSLDFSTPVPADDPAPVLETYKLFLRGEGISPYVRQQAAAERREQATAAALQRLSGLRLRLLRKVLAPAQRFAPLREDGLVDVGLAYPLLRRMLLELGRRCTAAGLIDRADDIFWLRQAEIEQAAPAIDRGERLSSLAETVAQRKAGWRAARRVTPPMMLPQIKILGVELKKGGRRPKARGNTLRGVATSPGRVTGPARVLHGPEDFAQMQAGDVLVAAITTPAWTPLFARAAAVVTDVGGPLSHGSIVAREYGIPAVLGTGVATKRITSGQTIIVDGTAGTVVLCDGAEPPHD